MTEFRDKFRYKDGNTINNLKAGEYGVGGGYNSSETCIMTQKSVTASVTYTISLEGCDFVAGAQYSLFVYTEDSNIYGDGILSSAVDFYVPMTNFFLEEPGLVTKPDVNFMQFRFKTAGRGRVYAILSPYTGLFYPPDGYSDVASNFERNHGPGGAWIEGNASNSASSGGNANNASLSNSSGATNPLTKMSWSNSYYTGNHVAIEDIHDRVKRKALISLQEDMYGYVNFQGQDIRNFEYSPVKPIDVIRKASGIAVPGVPDDPDLHSSGSGGGGSGLNYFFLV